MTELLNVWREIGSYNRFAETKIAFFIGLLIAILSSTDGPHQGFNILGFLRGGSPWIVNVTMLASLLVASLALIPQLAPRKLFDFLIPGKKSANSYYFLTIANYPSGEAWLRALAVPIEQEANGRAVMLAEQIHILAKITARKFSLLRLCLMLSVAGWVGSWIPAFCAVFR